MSKELDSHYYSLRQQRVANESKQQAVQAEIDGINQKIDRLQTAYNAIGDRKGDLKIVKKAIVNLPSGYKKEWRGEKANEVFNSCNGGDLQSSYENYISGVDSIQDAINVEICTQKNLRAEKRGVFQGLVSGWHHLTTQIQNYFN